MKKNEKNSLLKKAFIRFILEEAMLTLAFTLLFLFANWIIFRSDFGWLYEVSPRLYRTLRNLLAGPFPLFLLVFSIWFLLSSVLLYKTIQKAFSYVQQIVDATHALFQEDAEYITLPSALSDIESTFNHLKLESETNKKLAKESEQKKDELIVYLAHDIKTPLTSMIGYLSILDEIDDMPKEKRQKYIAIALEKSYRLEELINELFDVARFNSEKIVLEKEELNLNIMLEQIIDDFYPTLKELEKEVKLYIDERINLFADPDKLSRVFSNLLKNAIHYSSKESAIHVQVQKREGYVFIDIINQGKQIPKEKLDRIFEKFYRLDSSRTSKTGGSGLGLAIARDIVELHNGQISAESTEKKTIFHVKLPL